MLSMALSIISDGYNPVIIELERLENQLGAMDKLRCDWIESVVHGSVTMVEWKLSEIEKVFSNHIDLVHSHIVTFIQCKSMANSQFHRNSIREMIEFYQREVETLILADLRELHTVRIDTNDGSLQHVILASSENYLTAITFGCYIH